MLGLPEKVGGAHFCIDALVGDDEGFRRSGEQVDANSAVELPLGLGDKGVARADQHVDGFDRLRSEGHCTDGLDAAERVDDVGASQMLAATMAARVCPDKAARR